MNMKFICSLFTAACSLSIGSAFGPLMGVCLLVLHPMLVWSYMSYSFSFSMVLFSSHHYTSVVIFLWWVSLFSSYFSIPFCNSPISQDLVFLILCSCPSPIDSRLPLSTLTLPLLSLTLHVPMLTSLTLMFPMK